MFNDVMLSFRKHCINFNEISPELYIKLSDAIKKSS